MSRYQVSTKVSEIAHSCCYNCSIVDTTKPYPYKEGTFCAIAEVNDFDMAHRICALLNSEENSQ